MSPLARRRGALSVATACLLAGGCSAIRFGAGEPDVDLSGTWVGSMRIQGERIATQLELVQRADALQGVLHTRGDIDLAARVEGDVDRDATFALEFSYSFECPGDARLEGHWEEEGLRLLGTLAASDCTGASTGTFSFRRR